MTEEQIENCKDWIKALRSGDYIQGRDYLKKVVLIDENSVQIAELCCLGVACDITDDHKLIKSTSGNFYTDPENGSLAIPQSRFMQERYGFNKDDLSTFMSMNDDQRKSFEEIADYIESRIS